MKKQKQNVDNRKKKQIFFVGLMQIFFVGRLKTIGTVEEEEMHEDDRNVASKQEEMHEDVETLWVWKKLKLEEEEEAWTMEGNYSCVGFSCVYETVYYRFMKSGTLIGGF